MWMAFHGRVYDVTTIAREHPGGMEVMMSSAGADGTEPFEEVGHSMESRRWCQKYEVGILEGYTAETAPGIMKNLSSGKRIDPKLLSQNNNTTIRLMCLLAILLTIVWFLIKFNPAL